MAEAILGPEWVDRYYSYDSRWGPDEELASMRDGSGDEYSIVFTTAGVYIRGFAHESPMSPAHLDGQNWPGVLDGVPEVFAHCVTEPAFSDERDRRLVTACLWRQTSDDRWHTGDIEFPAGYPDPDGSTELFGLLVDRSPEAYQRFATDYYEVPVAIAPIRHLYALRPLTDEVVSTLNPALTRADLADDIAEIGYPAD